MRPFLKWAGGKARQVERILALLPEKVGTYWEPFVGGGAVFFAMAAAGRFERAVLSDANQDLIDAYFVVRDSVIDLIERLREHERRHCKEYYYQIRGWNPSSQVGRAARFIYLNKTCFNGLYRVNRKGQFNVPIGRHNKLNIADEETLIAASRALQPTTLLCQDFGGVAPRAIGATDGDAVYFDPPYIPLSTTSSFAQYTRHPFGTAEHERLAIAFRVLVERGVRTVLSNSSAARAMELYGEFDHCLVPAARSINSKGEKRGEVKELLVWGGGL